MAVENPRVGVVEDRGLGTPREQRLGLAHEELVERVLTRDEDCEAGLAATGTAPLLPEARHGPGEPDRDGAVQQPDVDAELEGIRRGDSEQLALDQPSLDLAALGGRIAGPVRRQPLGEVAAEPRRA